MQRRYVRRHPQSRSITNAKYNQKVRQRLKQQQSVGTLPKSVSVIQPSDSNSSRANSLLPSWGSLPSMRKQALEKSAFSLVEQDQSSLVQIRPSFVLVRPTPLYPESRKHATTGSFTSYSAPL